MQLYQGLEIGSVRLSPDIQHHTQSSRSQGMALHKSAQQSHIQVLCIISYNTASSDMARIYAPEGGVRIYMYQPYLEEGVLRVIYSLAPSERIDTGKTWLVYTVTATHSWASCIWLKHSACNIKGASCRLERHSE